jgi:soluble lytic murein transglycosylase-like protein
MLLKRFQFGNSYTLTRPKRNIFFMQISPQLLLDGRTNLENVIEKKGFSTALILRQGSTIRFGHAHAARDPNPNKERNFVTHVEADESASNARAASRAGASHYV